jgi:hypothetical protein
MARIEASVTKFLSDQFSSLVDRSDGYWHPVCDLLDGLLVLIEVCEDGEIAWVCEDGEHGLELFLPRVRSNLVNRIDINKTQL